MLAMKSARTRKPEAKAIYPETLSFEASPRELTLRDLPPTCMSEGSAIVLPGIQFIAVPMLLTDQNGKKTTHLLYICTCHVASKSL
jgi:hypothetical protein